MVPGINQWSLPLEEKDMASVVQHSVRSGMPNIELCIRPVHADEIGTHASEAELTELFQSIERAVNAQDYLLELFSPNERLDEIKALFSQVGARVIGVTTLDLFRYTLTSNNAEIRETAELIIKRMIEMCSYLGGNTILIEPGVVTSQVSYADAYENCRNSLKRLAKHAEEQNVVLALENVWGRFLMSPLEFRQLVDHIESEAVGVYFDVANVLDFGYPQDWIRIMGERIAAIHFKDFRVGAGAKGFCNPFDGDVDWPAVKKALEEIGFQGPIVAEALKPKVAKDEFISDIGRKLGHFVNEL